MIQGSTVRDGPQLLMEFYNSRAQTEQLPERARASERPCWAFHDCCEWVLSDSAHTNIVCTGLDSLNKHRLRYARSKNEEFAFCLCALPVGAAKALNFSDSSGFNATKGPHELHSPR